MKEQPINELGKCAVCGSECLSYEARVSMGESIGYPYTCDDCEHTGVEWYNLEYSETT